MTWAYLSVPFLAAKLSQEALKLPPRTSSRPTMIRMARPASRNSHFCTRQYTRPPKISSSANRTFSTVPNAKTSHCMWMPRKSYLASRSFAAVIQPWLPVTVPIVIIAVGAAKVSANQALKPIQKKISQMPWLHDSSQPRNGCSERLTNT